MSATQRKPPAFQTEAVTSEHQPGCQPYQDARVKQYITTVFVQDLYLIEITDAKLGLTSSAIISYYRGRDLKD
jgi:hypothetical protein